MSKDIWVWEISPASANNEFDFCVIENYHEAVIYARRVLEERMDSVEEYENDVSIRIRRLLVPRKLYERIIEGDDIEPSSQWPDNRTKVEAALSVSEARVKKLEEFIKSYPRDDRWWLKAREVLDCITHTAKPCIKGARRFERGETVILCNGDRHCFYATQKECPDYDEGE